MLNRREAQNLAKAIAVEKRANFNNLWRDRVTTVIDDRVSDGLFNAYILLDCADAFIKYESTFSMKGFSHKENRKYLRDLGYHVFYIPGIFASITW